MATLTEHKRIKFGALPGEIPLGMKIDLREGRGPHVLADGTVLAEKDIASLRRFLKRKSRAVQRRRDRRTIEESRRDYYTPSIRFTTSAPASFSE